MNADRGGPPNDLGSGAVHTKAKVTLAQISWLLGIDGTSETGSVQFTETGYKQSYLTSDELALSVSVAPTEPMQVRVEFQTNPPTKFNVDVVGEEGRSMDVAAIGDRVVSGVRQLSYALKQSKDVQADADDGGSVPTVELNPKARPGGRTSVVRDVKADFGDLDAQSQTIGFDAELDADGTTDDGSADVLPPQMTKQVISLQLGCSRISGLEKCASLLKKAVFAAKAGEKSDLVDAMKDVETHLEDLADGSPRGAVISKGILRQVIALRAALGTVADARKVDEEPTSSVERLRVVAKPESVLPTPYKGNLGGTSARKFIGARNRMASKQEKGISEQGVPSKDGLKGKLSTDQEKDFLGLIKEIVYSAFPGTLEAVWDTRWAAWSVRSRSWSVSFRVSDQTDVGGLMTAVGVLGKKIEKTGFLSGKTTKTDVLGKVVVRGDSYDDLGIQMGMRIVGLLRKHGVGREKSS